MWRKIGDGLVLLVLVLLFLLFLAQFFGSTYLIWVLIILAGLFLAIPFFTKILSAVQRNVWIYCGILVLLGLIPPTHLLTGPLPGAPPFQSILTALLLFMPSTAIVAGGLLLYAGLTLDQEQPERYRTSSRFIALVFLLLILLITRMLYNIYWLMVWDSTGDSLTILWLLFPLLASLFSGLLLYRLLPEKYRLAALYGLLIPVLLVAVSTGATSVSFRQRTEDRAARISQAISAFEQNEGRYPQHLGALVPRYLLALPEPMILYQQDWCYDVGPGYYRLAYVDREHWSSPELFAHVYAAQGPVPDQPEACDQEIQALIQSKPGYYGKISPP